MRKLLGSPPLCLSIPHRVLSLLLIWAAELSSHNTKNLTPPQTSKCFLGKNTSTVLWAFPAAKLQEPFLSFFPLWFISLKSTTGIFFFCLWFNDDSFLCNFILFSLPFILLVCSLSPPSYNFLRFRFFSTRGYIGYKMAQLSHDAWNIDCANDSAGSVKIWLTLTTHLVMNQAPGSSCLRSFGLIHCKQEPLGYCWVMAWPSVCMRYFWEWMEMLPRIRHPNWAIPDADWKLPGQSNIQSCSVISTFWGTVAYGKVRTLVEVSQAVGLWEIFSYFCALGHSSDNGNLD